MVGKNHLDMLKEFGSIKNCDIIVLTTYSFDPIFFDYILLKEIRKKNPYAKIVVFVDSNHIDAERRTDMTASDYRIITVPAVFHPKIFVFCSDEKITSFIGSHNLTLSGFSHNLELTCRVEDRNVSFQFLEYIRSILSRFMPAEDQLLSDIEKWLNRRTKVDKHWRARFVHNLEHRILDQVIEALHELDVNVTEVTVVSPFFSQVGRLIRKIKAAINPKTVKLCIQRNNHTLNPSEIEKLSYVSLLEVQTKERRRIHSKIIRFKARDDEFSLIGSPNFTGSALNAIYQTEEGNLEAALLIKGKGISELLSELKFSPIAKEEVQRSKSRHTLGSRARYPYTVVSADYNAIDGLWISFLGPTNLMMVQIILQPPNKTSPVTTCFGKLDHTKRRIFVQPRGQIGGGTVVWLCGKNGSRISNKAFVNVLGFSKRPFPSRVKSIKQILTYLADTKTLGDLMRLAYMCLVGGSTSSIFSRDSSQSQIGQRETSMSSAFPSRKRRKEKTAISVLEELEDLFRLSRSGWGRREYERHITHISEPIPIPIKVKGDFEARIKKIPLKFADSFEKTRLQAGRSPDVYTLYLSFSMKLCDALSTTFQMDQISDLLLSKSLAKFEEFQELYGISEGDCSRLLSLLIFFESQKERHIKRKIVDQIADRSSLDPLVLFNLDTLRKIGFEVVDEEAYLNLAENIVAESLERRVNLWRSFVADHNMIQSLHEYYRSIIPECREAPPTIFKRAIIGDAGAVSELMRFGIYPLIRPDGLPEFHIKTTSNQILENTFQILQPGFEVFNRRKNAESRSKSQVDTSAYFMFLKRIILKEIKVLLGLVSFGDSSVKFVPGKMLREIERFVTY